MQLQGDPQGSCSENIPPLRAVAARMAWAAKPMGLAAEFFGANELLYPQCIQSKSNAENKIYLEKEICSRYTRKRWARSVAE